MIVLRHVVRLLGAVVRFAIAERSPSIVALVVVGLLVAVLGVVQAAGLVVVYPFL